MMLIFFEEVEQDKPHKKQRSREGGTGKTAVGRSRRPLQGSKVGAVLLAFFALLFAFLFALLFAFPLTRPLPLPA